MPPNVHLRCTVSTPIQHIGPTLVASSDPSPNPLLTPYPILQLSQKELNLSKNRKPIVAGQSSEHRSYFAAANHIRFGRRHQYAASKPWLGAHLVTILQIGVQGSYPELLSVDQEINVLQSFRFSKHFVSKAHTKCQRESLPNSHVQFQ